ncbi:MAG: HIT domain-containing protein [Dehalococcoidales bacterium]
MERLWAPWRIRYIEKAKEEKSCFLCDLPAENKDAANYILYRGRLNYVILNSYPYNAGHLMVAPYRHVAGLDEMTAAERSDHIEVISRAIKVLKEVFEPEGFNTGINMGRIAGAGVDKHIHSHVVPRWQGDSNFMPLLADTKVINEALEETYQKLSGKF